MITWHIHASQSIGQSSSLSFLHENLEAEGQMRNVHVLYVHSTGPEPRLVPAGSFGETKKQQQPHTREKPRQPWRTKRTSPTYARRGRRSWASWDVPRPSYLPVSFEGKDRLNGIPCCSSFGGREVEAKCRSVRFCPRKPSRRDVLIPT